MRPNNLLTIAALLSLLSERRASLIARLRAIELSYTRKRVYERRASLIARLRAIELSYTRKRVGKANPPIPEPVCGRQALFLPNEVVDRYLIRFQKRFEFGL